MFEASSAERLSDREVVFTRSVDAPRERVWMIWAELRHLHRWWGPAGFTTTTHEFTFAPGGVWRFVMHGPDGTDYPNESVFTEVVAPERIVLEHLREVHHFFLTITFAAQGDNGDLVSQLNRLDRIVLV